MSPGFQLAKKVSSQVQIESVNLRSAELQSNFDLDEFPSELILAQRYRCSFSIEPKERLWLKVTIDFQFEAKLPESEGDNDVLVAILNATFRVAYSLPADFAAEDECYQEFADINGVYNVWPYWRELVQTSMGRLGLPGVIIPVYRPQGAD